MNTELVGVLTGFTGIQTDVIRGITHTHIRVTGVSRKISKRGFVADVYVNCRTQEVSIARIDICDNMALTSILSVLSRFQF
uniref:Uncharacterized protein n=1 Tax=viral metagenome TaxID=1070528 RepID=A0A6C0B2S3_9ZZZZ